jgi:hypothetical protein
MVVFKGHKPADRHELSQMLRGINGPFCFYDDLSLWDQCKYDGRSYIAAVIRKALQYLLARRSVPMDSVLQISGKQD